MNWVSLNFAFLLFSSECWWRLELYSCCSAPWKQSSAASISMKSFFFRWLLPLHNICTVTISSSCKFSLTLCANKYTNVLWIRNCRQSADAAAAGQTLHVHSPDGSSFLREVTSWPHLESMTSYQNSDSVNRWVFNWRTILPDFIPIRFETTKVEENREFYDIVP